MGSGFGGRKSLIRMIADELNKKADELERQVQERKNEQRQAANSIRYGAQTGNNYNKVTKRPKTVLQAALIDMDMIFIMDTRDIIPEWHNFENTVCNPVFRIKI